MAQIDFQKRVPDKNPDWWALSSSDDTLPYYASLQQSIKTPDLMQFAVFTLQVLGGLRHVSSASTGANAGKCGPAW